MELQGKHINKTFADKLILNDFNFSIKNKQKIGIIGGNGSGKSTLLKIIAKEESFDENTNSIITASNDTKIAYLKQQYDFDKQLSIIDFAVEILSENATIIENYEIQKILSKFGINNFDARICDLSGGQKRRVVLATTLLINSNLLILDEPTNHLDEFMISFLEEYLQNCNKAILMITHDRYFLDKICSSIWEIENSSLNVYNDANYNKYLEFKAQNTITQESQKRKLLSSWKTEYKYVSQGAKARSSKNKIRMEGFKELDEKVKNQSSNKLEFSSFSSRIGKEIISIENISKSFDTHNLFNDFTYNFQKNDRIGVIGKNGSGKSTLLKIIAGIIQSDSGSIKIGKTIKLGYFSQDYLNFDENQRVIDYLKDFGQFITTPTGTMSNSKFLESFDFSATLQQSYIKDLSGGQKRKLQLVSTLLENPNVLILDEPTNDLDLDVLIALENFLLNFEGVIICVSHDRYFLDKVTNTLLVFDQSNISIFNGLFYEAYHSLSEKNEKSKTSPLKKEKPVKKKSNFDDKFSFKEKQEFDTIDATIESVEEKIKIIDAKFSDPNEASNLLDLSNERQKLEDELSRLQERWFYLHEKNERINS